MKILKQTAFFIFFSFSLLFVAQTQAQNFLFLSHNDFLKLTDSEKKSYIREVQNLVVQLDHDLGQEFSTTKKTSWMFNLFLSHAQAQNSNPSREISNDPREESAKIGTMLDFINGQLRYLKASPYAPGTREQLEEDYFATVRRLYNVSSKNLNSESIYFSKKNVDTLKQFWPQLVEAAPHISRLKGDTFYLLDETNKNIKQRETQVTKYQSKEKPNPQPNSQSNSQPNSQPSPQKIESSETTSFTHLRCLYAGFVIRNTTCEPRKTLPDDYELEGFKKEDFKCKVTSQIICNPLLFGYQDDGGPYCISRSVNATKNCQDISNNTQNHKRLLLIWNNPNNKKTIENFQKNLETICSDNTRNQDVKSTCKVALKQFNERIKKEFPASLPKDNTIKSKVDSKVKTSK